MLRWTPQTFHAVQFIRRRRVYLSVSGCRTELALRIDNDMAEFKLDGKIGILSLENGKLNPLNQNVRTAVRKIVRKVQNGSVDAVVVCGKGQNFSAGADISEFGSPMEDKLVDVCDDIEQSKIPFVAAVQGYALGGGFELALACQYRIASQTTIVGFPEVKLGILPGAGGTQRFPRLVGLDSAMEWIVTGKQFLVSEAAELGAFDQILPEGVDVVKEAIRFARVVATKTFLGKRACDRRPPDAYKADEISKKYKKLVYKSFRGQHAPAYCVQAVAHSAIGSFKDGMKKEAESMAHLLSSGQSRGLTYSFLAQRQVQKWTVPGTDIAWHTAKPLKVKLGAVIGLGTMGRGIVMNFLRAGIPVIVTEMNEKFLESGVKSVHDIIDGMERRKLITKKRVAMMKAAISPTLDYSDLKDVDLVIEAVFEDMGLKEKVFRALDKACKPSAILATNTSAQNIDDIASFTSRPDKVMGMHFFAPANLMTLLENVYGEKTSRDTIATCMDMGKRMGKVTVLVGNCYGFVGNRMYFNYMNEADYLLEEGASPESVDKALVDFGFAMGRYVVGDLSGNDVGYRMRMGLGMTPKQQAPGTKENERGGMRYCPLADYICEKGRYGTKSGKGWYDYPNGRIPVPSPEVKQIIEDYRRRISVIPRRIDHQEVLERMLFALINTGFMLLDEGIASTPMGVDMVWIHGYAWPKHTGGPMHYAHTIGLPKVLDRIKFYHDKFGEKAPHWKPSEMLVRLVEKHGNPDLSQWMVCSQANLSRYAKSNL